MGEATATIILDPRLSLAKALTSERGRHEGSVAHFRGIASNGFEYAHEYIAKHERAIDVINGWFMEIGGQRGS